MERMMGRRGEVGWRGVERMVRGGGVGRWDGGGGRGMWDGRWWVRREGARGGMEGEGDEVKR